MPNYTGRKEVINDTEEYEGVLEKRGLKQINQLETVFFNREFLKTSYTNVKHVWSQGDRLMKLSYKYYGDTEYWWLIGMWNNKPTDAHYKYGQVVRIPFPVHQLYREVMDGVY